MAFSHIKFQSIPSLKLFTWTDNPHFTGLEVSLSKILMIGLFRSNYGMVIFSKTEKKIISQQKSKGSYIYDVHVETGVFGGGRHVGGGSGG